MFEIADAKSFFSPTLVCRRLLRAFIDESGVESHADIISDMCSDFREEMQRWISFVDGESTHEPKRQRVSLHDIQIYFRCPTKQTILGEFPFLLALQNASKNRYAYLVAKRLVRNDSICECDGTRACAECLKLDRRINAGTLLFAHRTGRDIVEKKQIATFLSTSNKEDATWFVRSDDVETIARVTLSCDRCAGTGGGYYIMEWKNCAPHRRVREPLQACIVCRGYVHALSDGISRRRMPRKSLVRSYSVRISSNDKKNALPDARNVES